MGKKPQRHTWDDGRKLCRLNQFDVEMAKRLGLGPDSLVRARPDPRQRWKLPVKEWICELHFKRFGSLLYPQTEPASTAEPESKTRASAIRQGYGLTMSLSKAAVRK